jgi:uncharacterized membrane protein
MHESTEALLAVYASDERASAALGRLAARVKAGMIALGDVGLLRRDLVGKVALVPAPAEAVNLTGQGSQTVSGLVGLIFPPNALNSLIDGASIGAVATQLKRTGVDGASLQRLGTVLNPGESAILVVVDRSWIGLVQDALAGYDHVVHTRLGPLGASGEGDEPADSEGGGPSTGRRVEP